MEHVEYNTVCQDECHGYATKLHRDYEYLSRRLTLVEWCYVDDR